MREGLVAAIGVKLDAQFEGGQGQAEQRRVRAQVENAVSEALAKYLEEGAPGEAKRIID